MRPPDGLTCLDYSLQEGDDCSTEGAYLTRALVYWFRIRRGSAAWAWDMWMPHCPSGVISGGGVGVAIATATQIKISPLTGNNFLVICSHSTTKKRAGAVSFVQVKTALLLQAILHLCRMPAWNRPYGPTCSGSDSVETPCMR